MDDTLNNSDSFEYDPKLNRRCIRKRLVCVGFIGDKTMMGNLLSLGLVAKQLIPLIVS